MNKFYLTFFLAVVLSAQSVGSSDRGGPRECRTLGCFYRNAAASFMIPARWIYALGRIESDHDPAAVSAAGARGALQVMPENLARCGATRPGDDIYCGVFLFASHLARFGRLDYAVAAYNAGEGAVVRHGGIPPYRETRRHVAKFWVALQIERGSR